MENFQETLWENIFIGFRVKKVPFNKQKKGKDKVNYSKMKNFCSPNSTKSVKSPVTNYKKVFVTCFMFTKD